MASNSSNWKVSMDVFESETGSLLDSIVTAVKKKQTTLNSSRAEHSYTCNIFTPPATEWLTEQFVLFILAT